MGMDFRLLALNVAVPFNLVEGGKKHSNGSLVLHIPILFRADRDMSHDMGLVATKPVFGVSDIARLKPACSATETS